MNTRRANRPGRESGWGLREGGGEPRVWRRLGGGKGGRGRGGGRYWGSLSLSPRARIRIPQRERLCKPYLRESGPRHHSPGQHAAAAAAAAAAAGPLAWGRRPGHSRVVKAARPRHGGRRCAAWRGHPHAGCMALLVVGKCGASAVGGHGGGCRRWALNLR